MPKEACPKGTIERVGYTATRKSTGKTYNVAPTCIEDVGLPGKTPESKVIRVTSDFEMGNYGYKNIKNMKADDRHNAIDKSIQGEMDLKNITQHEAAVKVMRHLNYYSVLNRNTNKTVSKLMERDRNWIMKKYETNVTKSKKN